MKMSHLPQTNAIKLTGTSPRPRTVAVAGRPVAGGYVTYRGVFLENVDIMDTVVEHVAEEFCGSIEQTIARFNAAREEVAPKLEEALDRYVERVERDAVAGLNRPSWLLSRSIASKVKNYQQNQKLWAIVGVKRETKDPRDPGVYGKYHEYGWAPKGRKPTAPARFLRKAKEKNIEQLEKDVSEAYEEIREIYRRGS